MNEEGRRILKDNWPILVYLAFGVSLLLALQIYELVTR